MALHFLWRATCAGLLLGMSMMSGCRYHTIAVEPGDLNDLSRRENSSRSYFPGLPLGVNYLRLFEIAGSGYSIALPDREPRSGLGTVGAFTQPLRAVEFDSKAFALTARDPWDRYRQVLDNGIDSSGILSWGRWTGPAAISGGARTCCTPTDSLHYVFGNTTPNAGIPQIGTALFNLVGATPPTISGGSAPPGVLNPGSQIGVQWGGATAATRIGVSVSGSVAGQNFQLTTDNGAAGPGSSLVTYNPATRSFGGEVTGGQVSGFFAGPNATHIGITYRADLGSSGQTAQGAAAFRR